MKHRTVSRTLTWLLAAPLALQGAVWGQGSPNDKAQLSMAVLGYRAVGHDYALGPSLANAVGATLSKTGRFKMLERQQIDGIMKQRKIEDVLTDPATRKRIGQLAGASYLIYGEVEHPTVTSTRYESGRW